MNVITYITAPDVARLMFVTGQFVYTPAHYTSISLWKTALFFVCFPHALFVCLTDLRVIWSETKIRGCKINTLHVTAQKQHNIFQVTSWHIRMCTNVQTRRQKYLRAKPTRLPFIPPTLRQYSGSLLRCLEVSQIIARGRGSLTGYPWYWENQSIWSCVCYPLVIFEHGNRLSWNSVSSCH